MTGPALIFDTETTSRDDDREIIEAAWLRPRVINDLAGDSDRIPQPIAASIVEHFEERYKPSKPLDFGAMAVHHILPSELEGCPPPSQFALPAGIEYIVGHSIDFDWEAIGKPNVKRICTHAMAGWVWPEADSYSQSALLYMLYGPTEETRKRLTGAHAALVDVLNNARLLDKILEAKDPLIRKGIHNLRHTFGHRLREAGVSEEDRALLLGHNKASLVQHYAMPTIERLCEMAERVTVRKDAIILRAVNTG